MNAIKTSLGIVALLALLLFFSSVFTIHQGQHAILLRLGKMVKDTSTNKPKILGPGLHFKAPFIAHYRAFDTRLQTLDIKSSRIVTQEKKDVIVDYYVKWRINDLPGYFKATGGNEFKAENLLSQKLNTSLRAEFGKRTIADVVSGERGDVMDILLEKASAQGKALGVEVQDVRIKGIDLPPNTSNAIYQRMRADMEKTANRHRADGKAAAEEIRAKADANVTIILAEASSQAQKIRAKGQAQAASIYSSAYAKNDDFFAFYQSMKAYKSSFNTRKDILVLNQDSQFFDFFKKSLKRSPIRSS